MTQLNQLIDGSWTNGGGQNATTTNPARPDEVIASYASASESDVSDAIAAAEAAQPAWDGLGLITRGAILRRAAELLADRTDEIAALMTAEEGKTLPESAGEIGASVETLHYHAAAARYQYDRVFASSDPTEVIRTVRRPLGVIGVITPWNFPVQIPIWKAAPALLWGNTVVWKPASDTPAVSAALAQVFVDAGVPAGVMNLVLGGGARGAQIVDDHRVAGVTFTGSVPVGRTIAAACVARGAKVQLELGGHNAAIVCGDADLDHAVPLLVAGAMGSTGQKCTATRRIIAVGDVHDELVGRLADAISALRVGDGALADTQIGPLVSQSALTEVASAVTRAQGEGATVAAQAGVPGGSGWHYGPTLLTGAPTLSVCSEEVFGPVSTVLAAGDLDEAITLANATEFGLTASIFTRHEASVRQFVRDVDAGLVKANAPTTGSELHVPFGGLKSSTFPGPREQNADSSAEFFTKTKSAYLKLGPDQL